MRIKNPTDFWTGLAFGGVGLAVSLYASTHYNIGSAIRMGPGYFPTMLSLILMALGALIIGQSLVVEAEQDGPETWNWKAYGLVILAPIGFGLVLAGLGLAPTMFFLIVGVARPHARTARAGASRSCCSTSTASRSSTTPTAIPPATPPCVTPRSS